MWHTCCFHGSREWARIALGILALLVCLYIFFFGLTLMRNSSKVMAGCSTGGLFGSKANPFSNVMIGILTTVLLQSSSSVVAIVVSLEEAGALTVEQGIFMIMGANVGTTITSTLVTLGQMRNENELELGVAAASTHTLFNLLTVIILFPLECAFGYLQATSGVLVRTAETGGREDTYVGPIKRVVQPLVDVILNGNTKLITGVAKGKSCSDFYPIECDPEVEPSYATCKTGLIGCDKETGNCPWLFREDASIHHDRVVGGLMFLISLVVLVLSTMGLIAIIKTLLDGLSVRVVHASTRCNGYLGILFGGAVTVFVQSSQVVVSTLVPFAGVGALPLETVYPIVVGSNVGTALQTVMVSLGAFGAAPLQVALAHLFFNVTGALLWYPLPHLRALVLWLARRMGESAKVWHSLPIVFIVVMYLVLPLFVFGLSQLYITGYIAAQAMVILVCVACGLGLSYTLFWCKFRGGYQRYVSYVAEARSSKQQSSTVESIWSATNESEDVSRGPVGANRRDCGQARLAATLPRAAESPTTILPVEAPPSSKAPPPTRTLTDMDGSEHYV